MGLVSARLSVSKARIRALSIGVALATLATCWIVALTGAGPAGASPAAAPSTLSQSPCDLAAPYKHVIYIQFDNQHLSRDNPNVPSDLEQVPALKNFLSGNGALLSNEHTPLISHTADDIVTSLTGLYPDRQGLAVSNSYLQYSPGSGAVPSNFPSAFTYWTDPVSSTDQLPNLITDGQKNTPAPWVPYTRAGCDVGGFSTADMELENTRGDITSVFGKGSDQQKFTNANLGSENGLKATDFEGVAIHCSQADSVDNGPGNHAGLCSPQNGGVADRLPDEPGGYSNFNGLFGAIYANQVTSKAGSFTASTQDPAGANNGNIHDLAAPVHDVYDYSSPGCKFCANGANLGYNGQPITSNVITDGSGNSGFVSGFDPTPAQTLGYVASMQEAGIPVTFAYIRAAHNSWSGENAFGPGEAGYVDQLKQENQSFNAFFERLAADGINKNNTLFVITADEGDHFAGGTPINAATCDGINVPCQYNHDNAHPNVHSVGEQDARIDSALAQEKGDTNPFGIHFDDNPNFYVGGPAGSTSPPGPLDPAVRQLEQDVGSLTMTDQISGQVVPVTRHLADAEDQTILHMTTTDPLRTPSFTVFGNPAFFYETGGSCPTASTPGCPVVNDGFAWNHGGDEPEVTTTWLGVVGPTVRNLGQTGAVWTDHTDIRPTMLTLLGLPSDYEMDGGVIAQLMEPWSRTRDLGGHMGSYDVLAFTYKQLNAPVGEFGHDSEIASTTGSESGSDAIAQGFDRQLTACQVRRDALASQMKASLEGAFFGGAPIGDGQSWRDIARAWELIGDMRSLASMSRPPHYLVCGSRHRFGRWGD